MKWFNIPGSLLIELIFTEIGLVDVNTLTSTPKELYSFLMQENPYLPIKTDSIELEINFFSSGYYLQSRYDRLEECDEDRELTTAIIYLNGQAEYVLPKPLAKLLFEHYAKKVNEVEVDIDQCP